MIGPKPVKNVERWAVVDFEGNVLSLHYSEGHADSAAWDEMRKNTWLSGKLRTCAVTISEVK